VQISHHANQGFLGAIFGIFTLSQHSHAKTEHRALKPLHKVNLRSRLSGQTAGHQSSQVFSQFAFPRLLPNHTAGATDRFQD
jgi:hypothetical protein